MGDNVFHLSSCFYNPVAKMTEPLIFGKLKNFFLVNFLYGVMEGK